MIKIDWHSDDEIEILHVMRHFAFLARFGYIETIDLQLRFIDLSACDVLLISALRTTVTLYKFGGLTEWIFARDRIHDELVNRGEDARRILHGLYPEDWK